MKRLLLLLSFTSPFFTDAIAQNVGINQPNPLVPLHFANAAGNKISFFNSGSNHYGFGTQASLLQMFTPTSGDDIAFGYGNSTAFTENVRIKGNGNVGIGLTNPEQALSIKGGMVIDQTNLNNGTAATMLRFGSSSGEGIGSRRTAGTNQYGIDFYTQSANRMTITNGGNVGIGLINPSSRLELRGALGFSSSTKRWEMNYDSTGGYFYVDEFGISRHLAIKNGGNVGIGTTNPQAKLDVNGDVNIENRLLLNNTAGNSGQALVSNGSGTAPTWQNIAYGNNDRFLFVTSTENFVRSTDTIYFDVRYSGSSAVTYNNGVFTINKSGFYKLEGMIKPMASITDVNGYCYYTLYGFFSGATGALLFYYNHMTRHNSELGVLVQFDQSLYLPAGTQFFFVPLFNSGSAFNYKRHYWYSPLSIYLISE